MWGRAPPRALPPAGALRAAQVRFCLCGIFWWGRDRYQLVYPLQSLLDARNADTARLTHPPTNPPLHTYKQTTAQHPTNRRWQSSVSVDVVEDGQIVGGAKKGLPEQVNTMCMCVCIYIHLYLYDICMHACVHRNTYIYMCVFKYIHCVCVYVYCGRILGGAKEGRSEQVRWCWDVWRCVRMCVLCVHLYRHSIDQSPHTHVHALTHTNLTNPPTPFYPNRPSSAGWTPPATSSSS